jgi:hypothetical protein
MDWTDYGATLSQAGVVVSAQLGAGDWEISSQGRYFNESMFNERSVYDRLPRGLEFFAGAIDPGGSKSGDDCCWAAGAKLGRTLYLDEFCCFKADVPVAGLVLKARSIWGWQPEEVMAELEKIGQDMPRLEARLREGSKPDDRYRQLWMESDRGAHAVWQSWQMDPELRSVMLHRTTLRGVTKLDHAEVWRAKFMFGEMLVRRSLVERVKKFWIPFTNDKKLDENIDHGLDGVSVLETGIFRVQGRQTQEVDPVQDWIDGR